ncbi:MAG: bifunctional phosphopantothenoylcysteine decarboxylase/phosphopantothenate--cysteine ligase CoaBC [Pseudomonadota bacterium]
MAKQPKNILLGISGGIAAYKTPQLVRDLTAQGATVQPVLTRAAREFVTATSLQAVSGRPVRDSLWDPAAEAAMGHIELARWADALLIAPATAQCLAQLANGLAPDLITTLYLANTAPVFVAPAMNQAMWSHPATQRNVECLRADGVQLLGPGEGDQACGDVGPGRMLEPAEIAAAVLGDGTAGHTPDTGEDNIGSEQPLAGVRCLITAGPTREALDPVRYLSNRSSGKQGFALAEAARQAGAAVTLVCGPTRVEPPAGIRRIDVISAVEMHDAVQAEVANHDVFIGVAAVADYRPATVAEQKIKKTAATTERAGGLTLELVENPDIIAAVARRPKPPLVVGFAAETERTIEHARAKLERKKLDLIVVNDVSQPGIGFAGDDNAATLITRDSEEALSRQSKTLLAAAVVRRVAALLAERG